MSLKVSKLLLFSFTLVDGYLLHIWAYKEIFIQGHYFYL